MKNVILSLVGLLLFVGCDFPTSPNCDDDGVCTYSSSFELDSNPFREILDCAEPSSIWDSGLYPDASAYSYCCCVEGAVNYSEHINFDTYSWNFNCDVSDSTYCFFE